MSEEGTTVWVWEEPPGNVQWARYDPAGMKRPGRQMRAFPEPYARAMVEGISEIRSRVGISDAHLYNAVMWMLAALDAAEESVGSDGQ